jgi:hypothetical protein
MAALERRLGAVAARVAPPPAALAAPEVAARAGLAPDPWQARVLRSTAPRLLLNASRQSGKSTVTAVLAVQAALAEPGALVLLLSPTLRQSGELFKKCLAVYRAVGRPVAAEAETALSLELANGARIVSLPGKEATIRGYSGGGVRDRAVAELRAVAEREAEAFVPIRPVQAKLHALRTGPTRDRQPGHIPALEAELARLAPAYEDLRRERAALEHVARIAAALGNKQHGGASAPEGVRDAAD